jgi:hypothetical protein
MIKHSYNVDYRHEWHGIGVMRTSWLTDEGEYVIRRAIGGRCYWIGYSTAPITHTEPWMLYHGYNFKLIRGHGWELAFPWFAPRGYPEVP